ncbi:hypothetical protein [Xenorhabdus eapokensis]|uniref:Uncharacterized protein n=1 Tax=Xenorhabdus eapokensis TaxID=1873482 RepID=A0A1Q5TEW5_9GAMM|nr:hypothetical protein [Xenorhabdus eapokensis]OKO98787.1 hypothetical protein Xedl_03796 [Xenorhabdus eapokensis]
MSFQLTLKVEHRVKFCTDCSGVSGTAFLLRHGCRYNQYALRIYTQRSGV